MINKKNIGTSERPRVIFSKTNRYIIVQAVDDLKRKTLCYLTTFSFKKEDSSSYSFKNIFFAKKAAENFSKSLIEKGISKIIFDRNKNRYHGNVEAFCTVMRELGINF